MSIEMLGICNWYFFFYCRYTLRNAEYRLCLEKNLDMYYENHEKQTPENSKLDLQGLLLDSASIINLSGEHESPSKFEKFTEDSSENIDIQGLGEMSPEAQQYILHLQSHISSVKKVCSSTKESLSVD
jgi:hypothetical protein